MYRLPNVSGTPPERVVRYWMRLAEREKLGAADRVSAGIGFTANEPFIVTVGDPNSSLATADVIRQRVFEANAFAADISTPFSAPRPMSGPPRVRRSSSTRKSCHGVRETVE